MAATYTGQAVAGLNVRSHSSVEILTKLTSGQIAVDVVTQPQADQYFIEAHHADGVPCVGLVSFDTATGDVLRVVFSGRKEAVAHGNKINATPNN